MSIATASAARSPRSSTSSGTRTTQWSALMRLSFRNLWRNKRRTWLTVSGIAFAVFLLVFARSMQDGTFIGMVDNIATMLIGHAQLQHPDYEDDPRLENLLYESTRLTELSAKVPGVAHASARAQSFALASHGERSFGAQVIGLQAAHEQHWLTLAQEPTSGRFLEHPGEAYLGATLARNLGVPVGGELILLGTAHRGGVAALALNVVGTFTSASKELDRALVMVNLGDFREAWSISSDAAHSIIINAATVPVAEQATAALGHKLNAETFSGTTPRLRDWQSLMPEVVQTMDIKSLSTDLFFYLIAIIVTFSIVNSFLMTLFERTPEFGMLMSLGMRPSGLLAMLQAEALWIGLLGVAIGAGLAWLVVTVTAINGIPIPAAAAEAAQGMNMPARFFPLFNVDSLKIAAICMLVATQLAAFWPAVKVLRLRPVEALRERTS